MSLTSRTRWSITPCATVALLSALLALTPTFSVAQSVSATTEADVEHGKAPPKFFEELNDILMQNAQSGENSGGAGSSTYDNVSDPNNIDPNRPSGIMPGSGAAIHTGNTIPIRPAGGGSSSSSSSTTAGGGSTSSSTTSGGSIGASLVGAASTLLSSYGAYVASANRIVNAIAVSIKQVALGANQISESIVSAFEMEAKAEQAVDNQQRLVDAYINHGPVTGIPESMSCGALTEDNATETIKSYAPQYARHVINKWVSKTNKEKDLQGVLDANLAMHHENFCGTVEAQLGACKLKFNGMQNADVNHATIYRNLTMHEDLELAAWAFVSNLVGNTVTPTSQLQCKSPECRAGQQAQMKSIALNTAALDALAGQIAARRAMNWNTSGYRLDEELPKMAGETENVNGGTK